MSDENIHAAIAALKALNFNSMNQFLASFLESKDEKIAQKAGIFLSRSSTSIISLILKHSKFGPNNRKKSSLVSEFAQDMGGDLTDWIISILQVEVDTLVKDPVSRLAPTNVTPRDVAKFSFSRFEAHFKEKAPLLSRIIRALCHVDGDEVAGVRTQNKKHHRSVPKAWDEEGIDEDLDEWVDEEHSALDMRMLEQKKKRPRKPRRRRNRAIIAVTVIAQIIFAASKNANAFQTLMGLYHFVSKTSKRAIGVYNQIGISLSPTTISVGLKESACLAVADVHNKIAQGRKVGLMYDNLVIYDHKAEETDINKNKSLQLTACAGYFLQEPQEPPEVINKTFDHNLSLRASVEDGADEHFENIEDGDEDEQGEPSFAIPNKHLFRKNPRFIDIRPLDIMNAESLNQYYPPMVKGHINNILRKYCKEALEKNPDRSTLQGYSIPEIFQIPTHKSEIFTLPTVDIDESTLDGNGEILERLISEINGTLERIIGESVPISGDQMTLIRIRVMKELKIRDVPEHKLGFASPWMGFLHFGFASADMVRRCHMGGKSGTDPASIIKFANLLGRTRVLDPKPDYNATHRLIVEIMEAHILGGMMEIAGVRTVEGLRKKVAQIDWVRLIDDTYDEFFPLLKVEKLRTKAADEAKARYKELADPITIKKAALRSAEEVAFLKGKTKWILAKRDSTRDKAYENALLFMQHSIIYFDFHCAMRQGDSGRLEKALEFFTILFEGVGKGNYAREMVEQQVDRKVLWTPYMRKIWQLNCLLNLSGKPGKFLGVDEVCEYIVKELKCSYNPKNTWQSKEFHMSTLSRLVMVLRDVKRNVLNSSGAPNYGYRHSSVDDQKDILTILEVLTKGEVLFHQPGRILTGPQANSTPITESRDAWSNGSIKHGKGGPLAAVIRKRLGITGNSISSGPDENLTRSRRTDMGEDDGEFGEFNWDPDIDGGDREAEQQPWFEDAEWGMWRGNNDGYDGEDEGDGNEEEEVLVEE